MMARAARCCCLLLLLLAGTSAYAQVMPCSVPGSSTPLPAIPGITGCNGDHSGPETIVATPSEDDAGRVDLSWETGSFSGDAAHEGWIVVLDGELVEDGNCGSRLHVSAARLVTSCFLEGLEAGDHVVRAASRIDNSPGSSCTPCLLGGRAEVMFAVEAPPPPPPPPPPEASADQHSYLGDTSLQLAGLMVDGVSDHLASTADGNAFVSLGGRQLALDSRSVAGSPEVSWPAGYQSLAELLRSAPASFALSDGAAGTAGSYALWGRAGLDKLEGKGADGGAHSTDLFAGTLGIDRYLERGLAGVGVSYATGDGKLGDSATDISLFAVHPYLRWDVSANTSAWGQLGIGNGNLKVTDASGAVSSDEDFQLSFAAAGVRNELGLVNGTALAVKADVRGVQADADTPALDADTWRARVGLEVQREYDLQDGGIFRPALELAARYDGGDTAQRGAGLDIAARLRLEDAERGLVIEGRGNYLAVHHESSKRQWGAGALVRFDAGNDERGLGFSLEPGYGAPDGSAGIWDDVLGVSVRDTGPYLRATVSYGTGYGYTKLTPYGELKLSRSGQRMLREGLRMQVAAHKVQAQAYAQQQVGADDVRDNSLHIRFAVDF